MTLQSLFPVATARTRCGSPIREERIAADTAATTELQATRLPLQAQRFLYPKKPRRRMIFIKAVDG
jgi:hypothetical protein